jgi:transcriptional regulator with XRE-family HTH domain
MAGNAGSLGRRRLGIELRTLRVARGLTLENVAERFDWSISKASRQELGRIPITRRDLNDLLTLYGVTDEDQRETLLALIDNRKQRRGEVWYDRFSDVMPRQFSIYLGFEGVAASISTYENVLIPGLLQTADYARAVSGSARPEDGADLVERRVEARMQRQEILKREDSPKLWSIVDEAALRRVVGSPDIMRGQLLRLLDVSKQPGITVQVLPFTAGACMAPESGFILLSFADANNSTDMACIDLLTRSLYLDDTAEVARYRVAFEHLRANAASPPESRKIIAAIEKGLHP